MKNISNIHEGDRVMASDKMKSAKSAAAKKYLKGKFHKLKEEGYEGKQRTAIALNMSRNKGYKT
jgi:hypothetical protein